LKKRVTIVLEDDLVKKLRIIQAKQISDLNENVSFSAVLTNLLKKSSSNWKP
jgi:hypothetical protein